MVRSVPYRTPAGCWVGGSGSAWTRRSAVCGSPTDATRSVAATCSCASAHGGEWSSGDFADCRGFPHFLQSASLYVEDVPVDSDAGGDQPVVAETLHVCHHAVPLIGDREPIDVLTVHRSGSLSHVTKAVRAELCRLEALRQQGAHLLVGEVLLATVRVVNDEPLPRALQLVRNDQGADRVVAGPSAGVADHMGVSLREAGEL